MFVSVIIPLYNKEETVQRALESIRRQTYRNFEVIVVDDGSTDGSREVVERFSDLPLTYISQTNQGPGAARNRGAEAANGDVLAFLDADDAWFPLYLERSISRLQSNPSVAATVSGYVEFPGDVCKREYWFQRGIRNRIFTFRPDTGIRTALAHLAYMCPWSTVIRTSTFKRYGGFYADDRCLYAEDAFLWLKVLLNERVLFSLTPAVSFHREDSALSANLRGARPVEPFLIHPEQILSNTPEHLLPLAKRVLVARATKTACMLGYWGHWRKAAQLLRRFVSPQMFLVPHGCPALVCSTPIGAALGRCVRQYVILREGQQS